MKQLILTFILFLAGTQLWAQTIQTVIVEHFTNSRCSICAARNPAFYDLLDDYPEVLHIAYHPSSPYPSCVFSQHNPAENDARTNYYDIYGGTPRVVVQGEVIPPQNPLLQASQIEARLGQPSDFTISVEQVQQTDDEAGVTIVVKKISGSNQANLKLYAIIAEKEIFYNAPNGESTHHDVFRKVLLDAPVSIVNSGDSIVLNENYQLNSAWVANQMYVAVMLQDASTKAILQSSASALLTSPQSVSDQRIMVSNNLFIPNPAVNYVEIKEELRQNVSLVEIYNLLGQKVITATYFNHIDISELTDGLYIAAVTTTDNLRITSKILKKRF